MIRDVWQTVQRMKLYILRVEILTFGLGFSLLVFAFVPVLMCLLYLSVVHIIAQNETKSLVAERLQAFLKRVTINENLHPGATLVVHCSLPDS